jgi:hypothetical protein
MEIYEIGDVTELTLVDGPFLTTDGPSFPSDIEP